jgi:integrase
MARVIDLWHQSDRTRSSRYGKGSRWQAVWVEDSREKKKSFKTKGEADAHLTFVDHHQRSGTYVNRDRGQVLVSDLLEAWVKTLAHLKPSTLAATRSDVRATIEPYWGHRTLGNITPADVQEWVSTMGKAARTVDTIYGRFRSFMNWCVGGGRIVTSPCRNINLPAGNKREHIFLTAQQVGKLADAIDPHYADLVWFLATTGLRFGEAAELRTKDVNLRSKRVVVARSVTTAGSRMVIGPPKSGKAREVPLTEFVASRLRDRMGEREALVFTTTRGAALRSNNFKRAHYDPAVKAAGLPKELWVHDLRHTAASLAISSGASVKSVQRMLGHASAALTLDTYAGLFDQDLSDVAKRLDSMLASR